ncbi:hypothetical protein LCGC14_1308470 [marine sediment metagenome]|uniref:Uncharacterized protein n=1 Tax=marine sediment metagenome TaxID=412755 RepID=A0A0F9NQI0_9ZZZZ
MITILFNFASDKILVTIREANISFSSTAMGTVESTIDGLKLDYSGVILEFPELEGKDNWKQEAIKRFKKKIKELPTEQDRADYIIYDLKKYGYVPEQIQKGGHRPKKIK